MINRTILLSVFSVFCLAGCAASVAVMNQGNNQYQLMASGDSQVDALNTVMKKANTLCQQSGKTPVVIDTSVTYQGMEPNTKAIAQMAATVVDLNTKTYIPGPDTSQDYNVLVTIKCQ